MRRERLSAASGVPALSAERSLGLAPMRRVLTALIAVLAAAVLPAHAGAASTTCGIKKLYGKRYPIHVVGDPVPCDEVHDIISGRCTDGKEWSCFSFPGRYPALVWFREKERYKENWSTTIEARRYPCSQAHVTHRAWAVGSRSTRSLFPTPLQILADDLVRCHQLRGMRYRAVVRLLGRSYDEYQTGKYPDLIYGTGPERDSFIQIDSELLVLRFDRHTGRFRSASFEQG
jgi:hypothetical protein